MLNPVTLCLFTFMSLLWCAPDSSFGPFNLVITSIAVCAGPKTKSCTIFKANVSSDTTIYLNLTVLKNSAPSKAKIVTSNNGKELVRFQMNKPCEHLFLRPLFEALYNVSKNCQVLKGYYPRKVDIGLIANNYFGGSFFYGNLTFRSQFYNDECNFSCAVLKVSMTPKNY